MPPDFLDLRTIFLLTTFVSMTTAVAMVILWRSDPGETAAPLWALGAMLVALGYLGIGLRDLVPAFVSIPLANAGITMGHACFLVGIDRLTERKPLSWPAIATIGGAVVLALSYYTFVENSTAARVAIQFVLVGGLTIVAALHLLAARNIANRLSLRAVAAIFLLYGLVLLCRVALMAIDVPAQNLFAPNAIHVTVFVVLLLFYAALMYCFPALLFAKNIDRRKSAEHALEQQKEFLNTILESEPECVKVIGADGRLLQMNRAGLDMLEVDTLDEARRGDGLASFVDPDYREAFRALGAQVLGGRGGVLEFPITGRRGTRRWLETHASPLRDPQGGIMALVGVTRDITERKSMLQELERQAHMDYLTGIPNRRYFLELAEKELARAQRYGGTLTMLMLDIDHFKQVNDTYGHQAGDAVLRRLAAVCLGTLREVDFIGRFGGEEFAILLPETGGAEGMEAAERLRKAVAASDMPLEHGLPLHLTISIGVATAAQGDGNIDMLIKAADEALYAAKGAGRNRVCATA